jgi:hypothetical protein
MRSWRRDGLILKPDGSLTAADCMFIPNSKYFLATTCNKIDGIRWDYLVINRRSYRRPKDPFASKVDIGTTDDRIA